MVMSPAVAIILGTSASGKTTLARRLAADLRLPCLCKDDVKEALFEVQGVADREWSREQSRASFAVLIKLAQTQLRAGLDCILEGNWRSLHGASLAALLEETQARAAQIGCVAEPREILRRFAARERHRGHLDDVLRGEIAGQAALPPAFIDLPGPRWLYQSDDPEAYPELIGRLKPWLQSAQAGPQVRDP
jgi:predicted kinase